MKKKYINNINLLYTKYNIIMTQISLEIDNIINDNKYNDNFFRCIFKRMFELIQKHENFLSLKNDFIKLTEIYFDYCESIDINDEFCNLFNILKKIIPNFDENIIIFLKKCNKIHEPLFADALIRLINEKYNTFENINLDI